MSGQRIRKSFGSRVPVEVQGLELELNDKVFKVRPKISGITLLRVIAATEGDDDGAAANAMIDFLEKCFLKEDRDAGMDYLENGDPPLTMDDLQSIVQYLIGVYTGNSTDPSPSSTSGSTGDGSTTTAAPSETVSTSGNLTELSSLPSAPVSLPST